MFRKIARLMLVGLGTLCAGFFNSELVAQTLPPISVNCAAGQSLNATLARLLKLVPITVLVQGTCTEYVTINGFEGLTLKAAPGAALQQPLTAPPGSFASLLSIGASRSVTIDGFVIHSGPSATAAISIGQNSNDVRLRNLTMDGQAVFDLFVYEASQVSIANVTASDPGFATLGAFDVSDVHLERSLFQNSTGASFHDGVFVGSAHVTMQSTTIRNMQVGIAVGTHGSVDIQGFSTYFPATSANDVVIENPAGTNFWGAQVREGALLQIGNTKLRITNAGQPWGGESAAVGVFNNSALSDTSGNLIISGSQGQGVVVMNNSHASLSGSSITGGLHGGLVVANLSSIWAEPGSAQTLVGGNTPDLFCDSRSVITGTANFAGVPTTNCSNLLSGNTEQGLP
jgi:hypothetical protein